MHTDISMSMSMFPGMGGLWVVWTPPQLVCGVCVVKPEGK